MNPKTTFFFEKPSPWQACYRLLQKMVLDCGLTEALKWGVPCYTYRNKNVVLMHGFNEYCALLFHKGALLQDPEGILVQQTQNVQSARQLRFTSVKQIQKLEATIKAYIMEAVEVEKAGLQVDLKKTSEFDVPEELLAKFEEDPNFKDAFEALTPGRQRGYLLFFAQAKQSKTRTDRIEKYTQKIFEGKGYQER